MLDLAPGVLGGGDNLERQRRWFFGGSVWNRRLAVFPRVGSVGLRGSKSSACHFKINKSPDI
jgi:hypothetical protein